MLCFQITRDGLNGINIINYWVSRRVQPLQYRDHGMHSSKTKMTEEMTTKRIRSLMKILWAQKVLKFGIDMYENGSCPTVCSCPCCRRVFLLYILP
jgi:hypothetical protein